MLARYWTWQRAFMQKWLTYALALLTVIIAVCMLSIINYTSNAAKVDSQRVFESSVWNTLQLQIQTYRFRHYLEDLKHLAEPVSGDTYFHYDLLMSRIDLLRTGRVGSLISEYSGGRALRLLNIINAELELVSFNVSKIEAGEMGYLAELLARLKSLDTQINEFVTLTNQGNNQYITDQHRQLQASLKQVQQLTIFFLVCLILLCGFILNRVSRVRKVYAKNEALHNNLLLSEEHKSHGLQVMIKELQRNFDLSDTSASNYSAIKTLQTAETLLALTQINAQTFHLVPTAEKLSRHLNGMLEQFHRHFQHIPLEVNVDLDAQLPDVIVLDFLNTQHIISALLQHAVINNHARHIGIKVSHQLANKKSSHSLIISLQEDGLGNVHPDLEKLRIAPMTNLYTNNDELTLKLSLAYKLVDIMGGHLHFACRPQQGCEFWLELPFHLPNSEA